MSFLLSGLRNISIMPVLSDVHERLVSSRLCAFMERDGVVLRHRHAHRKGMGASFALLDIVYAVQAALDRGNELILDVIYSVLYLILL